MASGSQQSVSSGWRSRSRSSMPLLKCYHDEIAPLRTVRFNGPTQGKRFLHVLIVLEVVVFFKWVDLTDDVNELQLLLFEKETEISLLDYEKEELQQRVKILKERESELKDEVAELTIESTETLVAIKFAKMNKKYFIALIMSWVFFALFS